MTYLLKGVLIEYASDFLGPLPNVVIFQFNPDTVTRTIEIPARPTGSTTGETTQSGEPPLEKIDITAEFSAADQLGNDNVLAIAAGVGPQLAALEQMVHPSGIISGLLGEAIDAIGDLIGGGDSDETQPVPRETYPRLLFIWGLTRVLPVIVTSMSITETKFDRLLNPVEAKVTLGLTVTTPDADANDRVAEGALTYSTIAKEALAMANLANTASEIATLAGDVIEEIAF